MAHPGCSFDSRCRYRLNICSNSITGCTIIKTQFPDLYTIKQNKIMKRNQTNVVRKSLLKSLVITTVLIGLTMTDMAAFAKSFTGLKEPGDTVKMTVGVPLMPEDISPLLSGENIPQGKLLDAAPQSFDLNAAVLSKPTILVMNSRFDFFKNK